MAVVASGILAATISLLAAALVSVGRASIDDSFDVLVRSVRNFVASISVIVQRDDQETATVTLRFHDPIRITAREPGTARQSWLVVVEPTDQIRAPVPTVVPRGGTSRPLHLKLEVNTPSKAEFGVTVFDLESMEPMGAVRTAAPEYGSPPRRSIVSGALQPVRLALSSLAKVLDR